MRQISPAGSVRGSVLLPGDKSISHRFGMLASICEGPSKIRNYSSGADPQSTLDCMKALGVPITRSGSEVTIEGQGLDGLRAPAAPLDAGNSGSTIRMLAGLLAGQPFSTEIFGDESLSRRPMQRVMAPLGLMGARIDARDGKYPPVRIQGVAAGERLRAIDYEPPMASAQVKTCVLFAGLFAEGETRVHEPVRTRDHSEIALRELGAELTVRNRVISMQGRPKLTGRDLFVPGDLSSAAFFLVAALVARESKLLLTGVGLNPTRAGLIDFLMGLGARIKVLNVAEENGELVGELQVEHSDLKPGVLEGAMTAAVIDEIPVLAVMGALGGGLSVKDAGELRVKETDRIATVAENLRRMGGEIDVHETGFVVPGGQKLKGAEVDSFTDHRIAMAFAVAGLSASGETTIANAEAASVSFPEFYDTLRQITA
ncbi:MAG: 3-phosphoshikimate 1-carboxyvinyltransferase [Acidobacteria bacterium]|nr:3-phosphoshikimate 1-carboxyvinyltransferase [Acidobacteriota bacterium]